MSATRENNLPSRRGPSQLPILYVGTSTFAIPLLVKLFEEGFRIAGVVTQPDKPGGRGQSMRPPPVKARALELQLPVYQPTNLKDEAARTLFEALAPEMIVVAAYGKILPEWLLKLPKLGCVNLHGSLLPKYRGAAPIHWAIANGDRTTGVCTMQMDVGMDTGPIYLCAETPIGPEETVSSLSERLAAIGCDLTVRTIQGILDGTLEPRPQDHGAATTAPILKKSHGFIDWRRPAESIYNQVRAFNPWPGTVSRFRGTTCRIARCRIDGPADAVAEPGQVLATKRTFAVACGNAVLLEVLEIQPENRKPVSGRDFVNGTRIQTGEKFDPVMDN